MSSCGKEKPVTIQLLQQFSIPLIVGVATALVWANIDYQSYHNILHFKFFKNIDLHFLVNDIFMLFFFGIAAVEITQSLLPGGDLNPLKKAINPLMATLGGVFGPIATFFLLNLVMGSPNYIKGWGITTATDIALAWLVARVVFGAKHPAVSFLLLLAIADDAIGLGIIAVFYPSPEHPIQPIFLLFTLGGMISAFVIRKAGLKSYWFYLLIGGGLSWIGLFKAGVHPALALVFIVPFMPAAKHDKEHPQHLMEVSLSEPSTITKFECQWRVFVDFGLFAFGLANAGVPFSEINSLSWIILLSLIIGKTLGIYIFSNIAKLLGAPLPDGMNQKTVFLTGVVAGLGLTVALFVAGQAFSSPNLTGAAKMGALFSAFVAIIAIILGKILKIKKID
ncbi:Na+/H+ antiporter NhaA [bacterium]|nr:Na+/H+ antiporter NhaA [bacterium]